MIVVGVGFRSGATCREIVELVSLAADEVKLSRGDFHRLATLDARAQEAGFIEAANEMKLSPIAISPEDMRAVSSHVATHSPRVEALHGVGSIAEASALAAAGRDARLLLRRIASARVTCALAQGSFP